MNEMLIFLAIVLGSSCGVVANMLDCDVLAQPEF